MKTITQNSFRKLLIMVAICLTSFDISAQLLLDGKGTPTLAFSTRKLLTSYTGYAMKVRRESDNLYVDVSFDSNGNVSLSSPVNPTTNGATLGDFVSGTDAFVDIWYNQTVSGGNATITTTKVVSKTGTITVDASGNATLSSALAISSLYPVTSVTTNTITVNQGTATGTVLIIGQTLTGAGIEPGTTITAIGARSGSTPNFTYELTLSKLHTVTVGNTVGGITGLYEGNLLMKDGLPYNLLGVVTSINTTTSLTLSESKPTSAVAWGSSRQPRLTKGGGMITLPNGIAAIKFYNGGLTNSNYLQVNNFSNDGSGTNLEGMTNINVFSVFNKQGNLGNIQGIFCSIAPTSAKASKFQSTLMSSSLTLNSWSSDASTNAISTPYITNQTTCGRVRMSGGTSNNYLANASGIGGDGTAGTIGATALDASLVMIYGVSGPRSFDGLSPELIFYGSTSTTMSETDAAAILSNQYSTFVVSDQTKLSQTNVTNITVYQTTKELIVKGNTSNNATATIVDITGKIVNKSILNAGSENVIKLNQLKGMYIVTLNNGANTQKVKIIVK